MSSACVAAVKQRDVIHHCIVIFQWTSGIMDCMLFSFKKTIRVDSVASFVAIDEQLQ